jgi:hypothetical protein
MISLVALTAIFRGQRMPRPWKVHEVPIAFWGWRNQNPSQAEIQEVIQRTKSQSIFLRAGEIDYQESTVRRIRPATGPLPTGIDLHLVYNATQSLLAQLKNVDEYALADVIAAAFREDLDKSAQAHAHITGIQLDFDVPTSLLGRYERILRSLRANLKPGTSLSITGLPTWMQSTQLSSTLSAVDFWIPQFYGAELPTRFDKKIPISDSKELERFIGSARLLDKPFFAGVAAFSWALLYSPEGALITVRGDIDPAVIHADPNLVLFDRRLFDPTNRASEWRYAYRVHADGVIDKLVVHAGEMLILDVPSAESLRESARIVRELAGPKLLGICVFRLPVINDPATLTSAQVTAALNDETTALDLRISFKRKKDRPHSWLLEIANQGNAGAIDLNITLPVDAGTIEFLNPQRGLSLEAVCDSLKTRNASTYQPCAQNRANAIRVVAPVLRSGQHLRATLVFTTPLSDVIPVWIDSQTDAGQLYQHRLEISVDGGVGQ